MNLSFRMLCVMAWALAASMFAQTQIDLQTQSKNVDFSTAAATKTVKTNAGLPATCAVGEVFFDTSASPGANLYVCPSANTWSATGRRVPVSTLSGLPATCAAGDLFYVTDVSTANGGWNLYTCGATNTWSQAGVQADGTGYLIVNCSAPSTCLVGPNLSVLPTLTGPNAFLGASDFSSATKTAMFRLAATAPATCDATAHEIYYDTNNNTLNLCTAANTWTAVPSPGAANTWSGSAGFNGTATFNNTATFTGPANFSGATKTAMFRLASSAPSSCDATQREAYFNTTNNTLNICTATDTWTAVPALSTANTWTGAANFSSAATFTGAGDFSGGTKTAMFRLDASAPGTCDATQHEAYYNTTSNAVEVCSATNTWTPINGVSGSLLLYYKTNVAALAATGSQQTLDSFTIPAGKLRIGDVVEIEATFSRTGTAGPITFGVSFGGSAMQSIAIPTSVSSATYKPSLAVTAASTEVWGGVVLPNGANPTVIATSSNATAAIASPITVSLTQNGTGPDTGAVVSWFVKVTR